MRSLIVSSLVLALFACSSTSTFSGLTDGGAPNTAEEQIDDEDAATGADAARPLRDAGRDGARRDASEASTVDTPIDPACVGTTASMPPDDYVLHVTRATSLPVQYSLDMLVSGVRGEGNASGDVVPQWFSFTVDAPRAATAGFSGSKCYMAMYFEAETSSAVSIGTVGPSSKPITLQKGTYYVKVDDTFNRYFGAGPSWSFYLSWDSPPPQCGDAGP